MYGEAGFDVSTRPQFSDPLPLALSKAKFALCTCLALSPSAHQLSSEGESASLNYQVATTTAGWLVTGAVPQSVYNKTSASTSVSGTFTDRRYGQSYTDGTITYVNSSFIHTNAGNNPHNTIQPSYGIYRFRRTK